jgi:tetratricopeptide (TPR) repeat protein
MKEPQPSKPHESAFHCGVSPAVAAHRVGRLCGRPLVLVLTFLASALAVMAAQTGASRAAGIHDHLRKAAECLKANDPNSAVKEFDAVLELDPKNAEAYANLGVIAFVQRDYQKASQYLRKALAIDPSLAKTQALLGICERRLGQRSAEALLEKSFPRLKDKNLQIQVGMELAGIYNQQGNLDRTASVMRSLVDLDPDNVEILYMAQRVYSDLADDTLNKLAILAPGSARMREVIAERLVNGGDLKGAIEQYKKALEINPHLPGAHFELGESLLQSSPADAGAQAEAEEEFETAIKMDGDSAGVECQLGEIAVLRSDLERAQAHYSRAYALNPGDAEAELGLGKVLMSMGTPQEAIKYLRMAVQSDPLNTQAHYRLGMAYKALKMTEEARHELQLFQEIKETKGRVAQLYRQMNKQSRTLDEQLSEIDQ